VICRGDELEDERCQTWVPSFRYDALSVRERVSLILSVIAGVWMIESGIDMTLAQIASDCRFAGRAHFSKLFRRFVGESSGEWRRARATVDA
jgi:AraC-like DNA-binding protein